MIRECELKRMIPGDRVIKTKGYPFPGPVRAVFQLPNGEWRLVVEFTDHHCEPTGLLHIFSPNQLELNMDGTRLLNQVTGFGSLKAREFAAGEEAKPATGRLKPCGCDKEVQCDCDKRVDPYVDPKTGRPDRDSIT